MFYIKSMCNYITLHKLVGVVMTSHWVAHIPHFVNRQGIPLRVVPVIEIHIKWNNRNVRTRGFGCRGRMTVC